MPSDTPDLTVPIPTYNRAEILRETLRALTEVDRTDINYEIVVVDNNSSDATAEVVKPFQTKLPLRFLKEVWPGKNCALNKALRDCRLGDIVIFTDDDPANLWLQSRPIAAARNQVMVVTELGQNHVSPGRVARRCANSIIFG